MSGRANSVILTAVFLMVTATAAHAQDRWRIDVENGAAISGRNDVRIPGNTGTLFSLTDDLASDTAYFWRVRADVRLRRKHVLSALAAPLRIDASGRFDRPVSFAGETFAAGVPVTGRYEFNSYRLTYRYEPIQGDAWRFGFGVTAKIRDAVTRLESGGTVAEKTNVGFVPLVNFNLERRLGARATFQVEGDALAAPQGRAEDVFAGVILKARTGTCRSHLVIVRAALEHSIPELGAGLAWVSQIGAFICYGAIACYFVFPHAARSRPFRGVGQ